MSFERLPEELLSRICKNCAESCHFPDPVVSARIAGRVPGILCENRGVEALSRVNSRLRRICLPTFFASLIISLVKTAGGDEADNLKLLMQILPRRPHIAQHVLRISYSYSGSDWNTSWPEVDLIPLLLPLVPGLAELSNLPALVTKDLIHEFNRHSSLESVCISSSSSLDPELTESSKAGLLSKITCEAYDLLYHDFLPLQRHCGLGMRIRTLAVSPFAYDLERLGKICSNGLTQINFFVTPGKEFPDYPHWNKFLGFLSSFVLALGSPSTLTCIRISSVLTRSIFLNDKRQYLPLLSDLLSSIGGESSDETPSLSDTFLISGYTLQKKEAAPMMSVDFTDPGYWPQHWDIVRLDVKCTHWPITLSDLQTLSDRAPLVRDLDLYRDNHKETPEHYNVMWIANIIDLAPKLGAFKHLRWLKLSNLILDWDSDEEDEDGGSRRSQEDAPAEGQAADKRHLVNRSKEEDVKEESEGNEVRSAKYEGDEEEGKVDDLTLIADMCHVLREEVPSLETVDVVVPWDDQPCLGEYRAYIVRRLPHEEGEDAVSVVLVAE